MFKLSLELRCYVGTDESTPPEPILETDGQLLVLPLSRTSTPELTAELNDLLDRVTPENLHSEVSTGEAVGRESW